MNLLGQAENALGRLQGLGGAHVAGGGRGYHDRSNEPPTQIALDSLFSLNTAVVVEAAVMRDSDLLGRLLDTFVAPAPS